MPEQPKSTNLERVIDSAIIIGIVTGTSFITDSNGILVGLSGTIYSTYHELKKFITPKYGKPSLRNYIENVATSWIIGAGIKYIDLKF